MPIACTRTDRASRDGRTRTTQSERLCGDTRVRVERVSDTCRPCRVGHGGRGERPEPSDSGKCKNEPFVTEPSLPVVELPDRGFLLYLAPQLW